MRLPRVRHAGWTIGARHIGVVVGLAILTPVFTADLQDAQVPAQEAIASLVLDAPLKPDDKIAVAKALGDGADQAQGPDPGPAPRVRHADLDAGERPAAAALERDLDVQLQRAATRAFRDSFLIGAGLALLALLTVLVPAPAADAMTAPRPRGRGHAAAALVLVAGVLGVQLANGGGTFEPLHPADPCVAAHRHLAVRGHRRRSPSGWCCSASTGRRAGCT